MLKTALTDYIGALPELKLRALNDALRVALDLDNAGQS
jgi:mRNA-degrading endonuclease toxin of MazEF toxin-antitoxin module